MKRITHVLICIVFVLASLSIAVSADSTNGVYKLSTDLSSTQGTNGWYALWTDSWNLSEGITPCDTYNSANSAWTDSRKEGLEMKSGWVQPSYGASTTVYAFKAPKAGQVTYDYTYTQKFASSLADNANVTLRIFKGDGVTAPAEVDGSFRSITKASASETIHKTAVLNQNDMLYFAVNNEGSGTDKQADIDVTLTYDSLSVPTYTDANAKTFEIGGSGSQFSGTQGKEGWYYLWSNSWNLATGVQACSSYDAGTSAWTDNSHTGLSFGAGTVQTATAGGSCAVVGFKVPRSGIATITFTYGQQYGDDNGDGVAMRMLRSSVNGGDGEWIGEANKDSGDVTKAFENYQLQKDEMLYFAVDNKGGGGSNEKADIHIVVDYRKDVMPDAAYTNASANHYQMGGTGSQFSGTQGKDGWYYMWSNSWNFKDDVALCNTYSAEQSQYSDSLAAGLTFGNGMLTTATAGTKVNAIVWRAPKAGTVNVVWKITPNFGANNENGVSLRIYQNIGTNDIFYKGLAKDATGTSTESRPMTVTAGDMLVFAVNNEGAGTDEQAQFQITLDYTNTGDTTPPTAENKTASCNPGGTIQGQVSAVDSNGSTITYSEGDVSPTKGSVTVYSDGRYSYESLADATGTDEFTVKATNANGAFVMIKVTVTLTEEGNPTQGTTSPTSSSTGSSPDTGDNTPIVFSGLILIASAAACLIYKFKNQPIKH